MAAGIETRHQRVCRSREGGRCNCRPSYRASIWSPQDRKLIRKTFPTRAAAKGWRHDAASALNRGELRLPARRRLEGVAQEWLEGARSEGIRNRSGDPYKPSAVRSYERALRLRVLPRFGHVQLSELRHVDVQDFVDALVAEGLNPSTIDTTLNPLRAIYRRAVARGEVGLNPIRGLELPAVRGRRERFASPQEAAQLIAAIPRGDRAIWATAMYAGLRRGELQALRWDALDLASGLIHVERSWDPVEGPIGLKTSAGRRRVPIASILRDELVERRVDGGEGLVFGEGERPFKPADLTRRADAAWKAAELQRITLHECRHSFASLMIAAEVNAKALSVYMGHANIGITLDRYGHLMPGSEDEAAELLDAYLIRAAERARRAAPGLSPRSERVPTIAQ